MMKKHLSILGSTGSIGRNVLHIAAMFPDRYAVTAISAKDNVTLLAEQITQFQPEIAAVIDKKTANHLSEQLPKNTKTTILYGNAGYEAVAIHHKTKMVVSSMVGAAGLLPTLAAIDAGKEIALANKETLVMAGDIVMSRAKQNNVHIFPVDSEHSAIFQCISGQRRMDIDKIILTASGGPFLDRHVDTFHTITPEAALNHPNWDMGNKISIDSATLMNKGLEVIEAKHLFDISESSIQVIVHPQSIVHSMVSYKDGSVIAQMGVPDMKAAISYALSYPERLAINQPAPDFAALGSLVFIEPDYDKFQCLNLAFTACKTGGTLPAVLNAANETAVQAFLQKNIRFTDIPDIIDQTMTLHHVDKSPTLSDIMDADAWARQKAEELITVKKHG